MNKNVVLQNDAKIAKKKKKSESQSLIQLFNMIQTQHTFYGYELNIIMIKLNSK